MHVVVYYHGGVHGLFHTVVTVKWCCRCWSIQTW